MLRNEPFETHADRYDAWFARHRRLYNAELRAVRALLPARGRDLEVGVGTGRFAAPLGIKWGVEPSKAMGKMARGRGIRVVCGTAEALPLRDAGFDLLLMVTVDCFLESLRDAFLEAHRALAEGGTLVVGLLDRNHPVVQGYMARPEPDGFYSEATFHTPEDISRAMDQAGFEDLRFVQTLFGAPEDAAGKEPVKPGSGQGSFVVVRGSRKANPV